MVNGIVYPYGKEISEVIAYLLCVCVDLETTQQQWRHWVLSIVKCLYILGMEPFCCCSIAL